MKPAGTPVAAALAGALWLSLAGLPPAGADLLPPGSRAVEVGIRIDWGPLSGRLARPAPTVEGDTWEALARREAGDAGWAAAVRDMNGGGDVPPPPPGPAWVPPRGASPGSGPEWFSAYVDFSKFGEDSDVSRTGLRRVAPGAVISGAFGTVTLVLLPHRSAADAARSHDLLRSRPAEWRAAIADGVLLRAPTWQVAASVPESDPTQRIEQVWRCEGVAQGEVRLSFREWRLSLVREERFDGAGAPLGGAPSSRGLSTEWVAGAIAVLVLAALALRRARRAARGRPPPPT